MKLILPVAGIGSRLRPHTLERPKCLLPVAGNTIIGHILDSVSHLDISETIFITGYKSEQVQSYISKHYAHTNPRFVLQNNPQGLGEAIHLCKDYLQDEPVLIILGDTVFDADLNTLCSSTQNSLCVRTVEDPRRFGVAVTNEQNQITQLVEKPETFVSNLALVGIYFIKDTRSLYDSLQTLMRNNIRTRGEYQLTDALSIMLEKGNTFTVAQIKDWLDCGKPETLLSTNSQLLKDRKIAQSNHQFGNDVTIIEPCFIGKNVSLQNCTIGPEVSLFEGVQIKDSTVRNSIIDENSIINDSQLHDSIVSKEAVVQSAKGIVNIGDYSTIGTLGE
jgi:glucose-1-phosphate thymidylyltransferase